MAEEERSTADAGLGKLVIKNPAQDFEDFECKIPVGWTVGNLKELLSQTYKGEPAVSEQKLIYSGKILDNKQLLSETVFKRAVAAPVDGRRPTTEDAVTCEDEKGQEEEVVAKVHLVVQSFMCATSSSGSGSSSANTAIKSGERRAADAERSSSSATDASASSSSAREVAQERTSPPPPPSSSSSSLLRNMQQEQATTSPFITSPLPRHHVPSTPLPQPFGYGREATTSPDVNANANMNTPSCSGQGFSQQAATPHQTPQQQRISHQMPGEMSPMSPALAAAYDAALRAIVSTTPQTPLPSPSPSMFVGGVGTPGAAAANNAGGFPQQQNGGLSPSPYHMMPHMNMMPQAQYPYMYAPNPYNPYAMMSPYAFYQPRFPGYQDMDPSLLVASQANVNAQHQQQGFYGGMPHPQAQSVGASGNSGVAGQDRRPPQANVREGEAAQQPQGQQGEANANANANNNNPQNNQPQRGGQIWHYVNLQLTLKLFVLGIIINHDGSASRLLMTGVVFLFVYMQQMGLFSANGVFIQKFCAWYSSVFRRLDNMDNSNNNAPGGGGNARPVSGLVRLFIEVQWFCISLVASLLPSFSPESFTLHLSRQQAQHARPHQD